MKQQEEEGSKKNLKLPNLQRKRSLSITLESKKNKLVKKISKINKEFRKKNNMEKDIKHLEFSTEENLIIFPNEIIFKDIIPGQIYQMKAKVKNLSKVVRRIRVFQPKSPEFRCDYEMVTAIAPGLSIDLIISFEATERGEFKDEIKIVSGNYEKTIPMLAYSPMAKIIFEPFINMGFIQVGSTKREKVLFKNEGTEKGIVNLKPDGAGESLLIEPTNNFELNPGEVKEVELVYNAEESGLFRGVVEVKTNGKTFLESIDINATCVEYSQFIIDKSGKELPIIQFGQVIFGQKKKISGFLVNNSPEGLYFKVNFLQGHFDMYEEENNILSPHEVGHEQTMRILSMEPGSGFIDSYSQIPVTFMCKTEVTEDHVIWTKNNCLAKGELQERIIKKEYEYTSVYFFSRSINSEAEENMTKIVKMKATGICPQVKFSENTVFFEKCLMGDFIDKKIQIFNESNCSIYAEGPNISQFHTKPRKLRLGAHESKEVTIRFTPKNLGKTKLKGKFIINGEYECVINLEAISAPKLNKSKRNAMSLRSLGSRGNLESGLSIRDKSKLLEKNNLLKKKTKTKLRKFENMGLKPSKSTVSGFMVKKQYLPKIEDNGTIQDLNSESLYNVSSKKLGYTTGDAFKATIDKNNRNLSQKMHRTKIDYLRESRITRAKFKKEKRLKHQMDELRGKIQEKMPDYYQQQKKQSAVVLHTHSTEKSHIEQNNTQPSQVVHTSPYMMEEDMKFMFNPNYDGLDSPRMNYPQDEKYLFVKKPIGKYLPQENAFNIMFDPDPNIEVKPLPSKPFGHTVTRDINGRLDGEMLKHIHAGPKVLEYGDIFVNSSMDKYFFVRNSLKNAIVVRILLEEDIISESYEKPQVILSGQTAGFRIRFKSKELGYLSKVIKYLINEKHEFKFMVKANVTRVKLSLSKKKLDIVFTEDNLGLEACETIYLSNKGNANAAFRWFSPNDSFTFYPNEDIVKPATSMPVKVYYKPNGKKLFEEEIMDLIIEDGEAVTMQVTGNVDESKCEVSPKLLDFGSLAVGETSEVKLELENTHSKNSCIYFIDEETVPSYLNFTKMNGRIYPQSVDKIVLNFQSNEPKIFSGNITILIRGNKPLKVPFTAEVIIPKIVVYEPEFDFGKITYGNSQTMEMTIENTSPILAKLKVDFRGAEQESPENRGAECLIIEQIREKLEDSMIIEDVEPEYLKMMESGNREVEEQKQFEAMKKGKINEGDVDSLLSREETVSEEGTLDMLEDEHKKVNYFILTLKPNKVYKFNLTFQPKKTEDYDFFLPFHTGNTKEFNGDIQKRVTCSSVPPKILMEPIDGVRDFKKIIISHIERNLPKRKTLKIRNPDYYNPLSFFIKSDKLEEDRVFFLSKNEGSIQPNDSIEIVVTFNPHIPGSWEYNLPLYLDDDRENKKGEILLKGEAAYPKLYFDRRQVIFPVVPLGVTSKSIFRIINDGFQNVTIFGDVSEDYSSALAPIKIKFLDGISMNIRKKVLKIEVSFKSNTPISFTARLDFKDDRDGTWSVYCSGTADNCLLTHCFYFMRNVEEEGEISRETGYSVTYKEKGSNGGDDKSEDSNKVVRSTAAISKMSLNSAEGNLGYSPIPFDVLQKYCRTLSFWLSETVPHIGVNAFPDDIIFDNGKQLLDLLQFLTKKSYGSILRFKPAEKQSERTPKLHQFYVELIQKLMEEGAYLCDIRPEFLLNYNDLMFYIKNNPVPNSHKVTLKLNETQFRYISCYSWSVLINQVIKLFYLSRVNLNKLKTMKGLTSDQRKIDKRYLGNSNIYSENELILLRWAELSLQTVKKQNRQLYLFDKHFKNGMAYACILQHYSDNLVRPLSIMKDIALSDQDCRVNMGAVKNACQDLGLTGAPTLETLVNIDQIQSLLFLCNLFQVMPFYMPKELIHFECVLHEHIVKKIVISNPTTYKMSYIPVISGSKDFEINSESVLVEPKSKRFEFPVKFFARLTRPVTARLMFKGLSDGKIQAAPIVYDLVSKVTKRRSIGREEIDDVQLYSMSQRIIYIDNPFESDVEFTIDIEYLDSVKQKSKGFGGYEATVQDLGNISTRRRNRNSGGKDISIPCFFLQTHKVYIKKGKKGKIRYQYIPLTFEVHMCHVILTDDRVGEMQYDLVGTPLLPNPLQIFTYQTSLDDHQEHNLLLSMGYKTKTDAYDLAGIQARRIKDTRVREFTLDFLDKVTESDVFNIELSNGAKEVSIPTEFRLYDITNLMENDEQKLKKLNAKGDINNLPLGLHFRNPVHNYSCMFLMKNKDYTDVRVYEVIITVLPKVFKAKLQFNTSARLPITQKIPVINGTKGDITFDVGKADLYNSNFFHVDKTLTVRKESTGYLSITYTPEWLEESEAVVIITNPITQEKFEYIIKGKSDEPLAEDHLKFKCDVGEVKKHIIPFKNPSLQQMTYTVKYDLHSVSGLSEFKLSGGQTHHYELTIKPNLGGIYAGMITFTDQRGQYWWYTMELESKGQRNVREYEVSGEIRKEATLEIPIQNNFNEKIEYSVLTRGKYIYGPTRFKVNSLSKEFYRLKFLPLEASVIEENTVTFTNPKSGEIFCVVRTTGREKPVEKLPILRAEIGKDFRKTVKLENPSGLTVKVTSSVSNPENFEIIPQSFEIPPYSVFKPIVKYIPNQVDIQNKCDIVFKSEEIGEWKFTAFGKGENPTDYEEKVISAFLKKEGSTVITFTNPFKTTIIMYIDLQVERATLEEIKRNGGEAPQNPFKMHYNKPKITLQAGKTIEIPISYIPQEITEYKCKLVMKLNDKISWVFPIKLVTEASVNEKELHISTICRKKKEKKFTVELEGVKKIFEDDVFLLELDELKVKKSRLKILEKWFKVVEYYANEEKENALTFVVKFSPQKPFKEIGMLKISRKRGGIWRFKIKLESVEPPVLDKIVIESPLNVTSTAQFKLTNGNNMKVGSPFTAEFSHESASEFNVYPKKGILQPMIKNGTMFNVTFTPVEYGKMKVGKLIIQTEMKYWSFRVEGTFPKYKPPKIEKISNLSSIKIKKEHDDDGKGNKKNNLSLRKKIGNSVYGEKKTL